MQQQNWLFSWTTWNGQRDWVARACTSSGNWATKLAWPTLSGFLERTTGQEDSIRSPGLSWRRQRPSIWRWERAGSAVAASRNWPASARYKAITSRHTDFWRRAWRSTAPLGTKSGSAGGSTDRERTRLNFSHLPFSR